MSKAVVKFQVGDNCTCLYDGVAYNAKIQDVKNADTANPVYIVHFIGWNVRYDEELKNEHIGVRLFPGTAAEHVAAHGGNLDEKVKKQLKASKGETSETAGDDDSNKPSTSSVKKSKKANVQQNSSGKLEVEIDLPKQLRKVLCDDLEMLNHNFFVHLPATYTIDRIITDYIKTIPITNEQMKNMDDLLIEYDQDNQAKVSNVALICTARGLSDYFNVVLGYQLLYKFERPQYNDLLKSEADAKGVPVADIASLPEHGFRATSFYGVIHLLRMISRLPELFKLTEWNEHLIKRILAGVHDFLVFINKNFDTYFSGPTYYELAPPDYFRRTLAVEDVAGTSQ